MSSQAQPDPYRAVRAWLWCVLAMIFAMVVIGGITRLTGSGLSMVEWHPLMGAVPPLSEAEWQEVFAQYQRSPQYAQVNHWMEIEHFKRIFFWEYVHRLVGRLIGVVFALPFLYFLARGRIRGRVGWLSAIAFALGGAQGLLGWYMVKSGLVDVPEVSHFRLAAHLSLAFATGVYVLWLLLELRPPARATEPTRASRGFRVGLLATMGLLTLQIVYGAFMAGKRAGLVSNTFPDMNGAYLPGPFFNGPSALDDLVSSPAAIHWVHRALAWALVLAIAALFARALREPRPVRRGASWLLSMAVVQLALGAGVVLMEVPVWLAVVHQAGAFVLLALMTHLGWVSGALPARIALSEPARDPEEPLRGEVVPEGPAERPPG